MIGSNKPVNHTQPSQGNHKHVEVKLKVRRVKPKTSSHHFPALVCIQIILFIDCNQPGNLTYAEIQCCQSFFERSRVWVASSQLFQLYHGCTAAYGQHRYGATKGLTKTRARIGWLTNSVLFTICFSETWIM